MEEYRDDFTEEHRRRVRREKAREDRVKAKRKKNKTNGFEKIVIAFSIFAILYASVQVYLSTKENRLVNHIVENGVMENVISGKGKIIRDENVIYAPRDGEVEYYFREGEKVRSGSLLCKIYEKQLSESLEEELDAIDSEILKYQSKSEGNEDLENVDMYIYGLIDEFLVYQGTEYEFDKYKLMEELKGKFDLKRSIILKDNSQDMNSMIFERDTKAGVLNSSKSNVKSPEGGIISYYIDGFEENYTPDNIPKLKGKYLDISSNKIIVGSKKNDIQKAEAICKVVSNAEWFITSALDKEKTKEWTINDVKAIRIKDVADGTVMGTIVNVLEDTKSNNITFRITEQLNKFMPFRDVEIEIVISRSTGLKVPNTSIDTKKYLKVDEEYITTHDGKNYVIKIVNGGNSTIEVDLVNVNGNKYIEYDENKLMKNDVIISKDTGLEYRLEEAIDFKGVYKVYGDELIFQIIEQLASSEDYILINPNGNISMYDKIVLDIKALKGK